MHFLAVLASALTLIIPVLAVPTKLLDVEKVDGKTTGRHIVRLQDSVNTTSFVQANNITATHQWNIINGFAAELNDAALNDLRADSNVVAITEDAIVSAYAVQTNAVWGLARLSSKNKLTKQNANAGNFKYYYDPNAGSGVDVYVIGAPPILNFVHRTPSHSVADSGVYVDHVSTETLANYKSLKKPMQTDFGGRARWGTTFGGYPQEDVTGHGTSVAGVIAGTRFGVAKKANIIAIRILNDSNQGTAADYVSAMDWVVTDYQQSPSPAVLCISLGAPGNAPMDLAVSRVTMAGIHTVVAAGNDNTDANADSPARVVDVITVGASNISDSKSLQSNYGSVVDMFAPGVHIVAPGIDSNTAAVVSSGTSLAAPYVAGVVASVISTQGNTPTDEMATKVIGMALVGVLADIPVGTFNRLAQNGWQAPG
ncbi:hypothetical protein DXG01_004367 [Tephrocybe rancida]|nr:hypothetical protein DXG01_004367 [Tephrocybe rancida]